MVRIAAIMNIEENFMYQIWDDVDGEEPGLTISFNVSESILREVVSSKDKISWLSVNGDEWFFDLEGVKEKFKEHCDFLELGWFSGDALIVPEKVEESKVVFKITAYDDLLQLFDELKSSTDFQKRGYELENLINELFKRSSISSVKSFKRNEGAEQIDGAFSLEGWHYLVECRWRKNPSDIRELDGLSGQINRSGTQTMGLFFSINGWSENVPNTLKQNPKKSIILMDGNDLYCILSGKISLKSLLVKKLQKLNIENEPFYSAENCLKDKT